MRRRTSGSVDFDAMTARDYLDWADRVIAGVPESTKTGSAPAWWWAEVGVDVVTYFRCRRAVRTALRGYDPFEWAPWRR